MDRGAWWATVYGVARTGHDLVTKPPQVHTRCLDKVVKKVPAFMELIQIEETGDTSIIIRGDLGPGWSGTTLLEEAPPTLCPEEGVLTGRDDTNTHLFWIWHPPSQQDPRGFPESKDTAESQLITNDVHGHASPLFLWGNPQRPLPR